MNTKKLILTTGFLLIALVNYAQTKQTMKKEPLTSEQNKVMKAILDMTAAFHKKDLARVLASYEPNAVIVFEPGQPSSGPEAIRKGFTEFFEVNPIFTYADHEVLVNGDLAMHFAPWTMTGKLPDGNEITQSGLSVAVLRKQSDGRWLMIFDNPFGQRLMDQK